MAKLCRAGVQLREQIDDDYPSRDRRSDGWIADSRHLAKGVSDHIPVDGIVNKVIPAVSALADDIGKNLAPVFANLSPSTTPAIIHRRALSDWI